MEPVVVTGMGIISPVGSGVDAFWRGIRDGQSAVDVVQDYDLSEYPTRIAAQVKDFDPLQYLDRKESRHMDRFVQFAIAAAEEAWRDAAIRDHFDPNQAGVVVGNGIGGMHTLTEQHQILLERGPSRINPFFIPKMIGNIAGGQLAIRFNLRGPNETVVTACASSGNAIGSGLRAIQHGEADVMLVGGTEAALIPLAFAGFCSMKAMSTRNDDPKRASRPFDRDRDGFVMGEGAGFLVLERLSHAERRGAPRIYAELAGYGRSADAYHVVEPHPDGEGASQAMARALKDAGMTPEDIDYINAHGTSTPKGDIAETLAIKRVFGDHAYRLAVSSTKSSTAHLLGAAGAVEMIAAILAIVHQTVPPTINLDNPDPECDLYYVPNQAETRRIRAVMSNAFGFGGQNATLIAREL
ncbi:MAG: beta-ketoacyl-ACP synthase II [Firmicutes bacterium]|jgi:3-oxoacyl-[acyl-carrier-protein] synthase II|nr:beta-ketoacyl-ACP synthase II [Bacillota bacterium]